MSKSGEEKAALVMCIAEVRSERFSTCSLFFSHTSGKLISLLSMHLSHDCGHRDFARRRRSSVLASRKTTEMSSESDRDVSVGSANVKSLPVRGNEIMSI